MDVLKINDDDDDDDDDDDTITVKARNECSIDRRLLQDCVTENRPIIQ